MATKRLVSTDGALAKATKGTVVVGNGTATLAAGWYVAKKVLAVGSGLPTNIEAGYFFYTAAVSGQIITPAATEEVIPVTFTTMADITSANIEYTKGEIDVTLVGVDDIKVYRSGMVDASGSLEGITVIGVTDADDGIIQKFIATVKQKADGSEVEISTVNDDAIFLQLAVNKESTNGEDTAFYFFPTTILGYSAGVTVGDNAQTFTSNFRITADDDIKAQFFELKQPAV